MRKTVLLVASLMLLGPGFAIANDHGNGAPTWRTKADEPLLQAYDAGREILKVEVVGPRVTIPAAGFETRLDAKAYYERMTATFLGMVRGYAAAHGVPVTQEVLYANAAFLDLPRGLLPDLLGKVEVRRGALDWMGATFILGDIVGAPGVLVDLDATIAKNQATEMHALGYRGEGIKLAGIDTGIRASHETLKNADGTTRVVGWFDQTEPASGRCATPCDTHFHGTHTIATAAGSNAFNAAVKGGVAPKVEIIGVRIFQGGGGSWEDAQEGLQAAFDLDADITTNSWGGGCAGGGITTAELAEDLQAMGMMNVFAAGNSGGGGVLCPGMVDNVLTVGAIDINEVVAGFSSRGPCVWPVGSGNSRICPDVNSVGVDVNAASNACDTCYTTVSGTSMATPHAAGVVVLLEQAARAELGEGLNAANKQAEIILRYSAKDLGAGGPDNDYGWGLAKAKDAYDLMTSDLPLNIQHIFAVGKTTMRAYETNGISLSVVNLGTVAVDGTLSLEIRQVDTGQCPPTCDMVSLSANADLGAFSEGAIAYTFDGATHPAGNYLVNARYDYTYSGGSGMIEESAMFLLKKVSFVKTRVVTTDENTGEVLFAGVALANVGNENATAVRYSERFRADGFVPLPAVPPGVGQYGLFANPAPDNVRQTFGTSPTVTYEWNTIGTVNFGSGWEADFNFLVGPPGTYPTTGTLRYADEVGRAFIENFNVVTTVTPPV